MKRKFLAFIILASLLLCSLTGCANEEEQSREDQVQTEAQTNVQTEAQTEVQTEAQDELPEEDAVKSDTTAVICSLCEVEKICGIYTAEGKEYLVCHDCSNEFITAFEETADKSTGCICEVEKICAVYVVNGSEYIVCPDDYNEFAHGMGFISDSEEPASSENTSNGETSSLSVCSLCEVEKECPTYTVDGKEYIVCDDCYNEFATAFGLNDTQEVSAPIYTCSLCEVEKICGTYTAEGQEYIVCHDCSNEFIDAFSETADKHTCSGCQVEKICGSYIVDGQEYIVCPDDFLEFAHGMNLM